MQITNILHSSIRLRDGEAWFITPENTAPTDVPCFIVESSSTLDIQQSECIRLLTLFSLSKIEIFLNFDVYRVPCSSKFAEILIISETFASLFHEDKHGFRQDIHTSMHSYDRKSLVCQLFPGLMKEKQSLLHYLKLLISHPIKIVKTDTHSPKAPSAMLAVMLRIEKMQEEILKRCGSVEEAVKDNSTSVKNLTESL